MQRILFSVKSGHHKVGDVRDLRGVLDREKAAIGVVLTLNEPTKPMIKEAAEAGSYTTTHALVQEKFPRIQILTVAELQTERESRHRSPLSARGRNVRCASERVRIHAADCAIAYEMTAQRLLRMRRSFAKDRFDIVEDYKHFITRMLQYSEYNCAYVGGTA